MIRFVYMGSQITDIANENARDFAFFNTVTDRFVEINGCWVFSSIEEFRAFASDHPDHNRCKNLIPSWYINNDKPPDSGNSVQVKKG